MRMLWLLLRVLLGLFLSSALVAIVLLRPALLVALGLRLMTGLLVHGIARLEARDDADLDLAVHELFDVHHQRPVVEGDQRYGFAG